MSRRRLLYGTSGPGPTPEPEPNWIAASGLAYIDLGVTPTNKSGIRIVFDVKNGYDTSKESALCGSEIIANNSTFDAMYFRVANTCHAEWGSSVYPESLTFDNPDAVYEWRQEANAFNLLMNDVVVKSYSFPAQTFTCTGTLFLFNMNRDNIYSPHLWSRCPRVRKVMYTDDCTIANPVWNEFTPYYLASQQKYGLIDSINYRFYDNKTFSSQGTIIGHVE